MKKKLLLLAGILVLGATTFANTATTAEKAVKTSNTVTEGLLATRQIGEGGFEGTYLGEVVYKGWVGPNNNDYSRLEWTIAKGKLNFGKLGFVYDIDRDFHYYKSGDDMQGMDTHFTFDYQAGSFDMLGKEWKFVPAVTFNYDSFDDTEDTRKSVHLKPKFSATYYGFATDVTPAFGYDDINETFGFELSVDHYRKLSDYWSSYGTFYFTVGGTDKDGVYGNDLYSGNISKDDRYAFSLEQYFAYDREVFDNLYFKTEFGIEAYSLLQNNAGDADLYVAPELYYMIKMGKSTVKPYLRYTSYMATGTMANYYAKEEVAVGVSFGTSF